MKFIVMLMKAMKTSKKKTLLLQAGEVTVDETGLKLDDEDEEETEQE